jgi:hypothetical protein
MLRCVNEERNQKHQNIGHVTLYKWRENSRSIRISVMLRRINEDRITEASEYQSVSWIVCEDFLCFYTYRVTGNVLRHSYLCLYECFCKELWQWLIHYSYAMLDTVHYPKYEYIWCRVSGYDKARYFSFNCSSWYRAPLWGPWPDLIFILSLWQLICCYSYRAPSLTRGRVCNLQWNRWLVRSLRTNYRLIWDCVPPSSPLTTRRDYGGSILTRLNTGCLVNFSDTLRMYLRNVGTKEDLVT